MCVCGWGGGYLCGHFRTLAGGGEVVIHECYFCSLNKSILETFTASFPSDVVVHAS